METEYIEKLAAIDALGEEPEIWCETDEEAATRNQWERDKAAIESVPPADVRPVVRGRWVNFDRTEIVALSDSGFVSQEAYCSVCNVYLGGSAEYDVKGNFCPNCGAEMVNENE